LSPNARQISRTVVWEIPCLFAKPRLDQCIASGGAVSRVSKRGQPGSSGVFIVDDVGARALSDVIVEQSERRDRPSRREIVERQQ
jgi:hypothetical protein